MQTTTPEHFSIKEAAVFLGVPETTILLWLRRRTGPPVRKFGRSVRFHAASLEQWAAEQVRP
jgi:excisionase family DNA binding protein